MDFILIQHVKENKLITDGVFAYVRHPIYSAFPHLFIGLILLMNNIYLLILPILFWIFLTVLMILTEEKKLVNEFGEAYINYAKKTDRVILFRRK